MTTTDRSAENITWVSSRSLVRLRHDAGKIPLYRGRIKAQQGGSYISSFKGRGMEFDESRIYLPGDDIRNMDWRVTARTGIAHTKVYQEERERPILLWLDLNPSMFFATRGAFKSVIAARVAALLGWCATANNDRVGALIFAGDNHVEMRPKRGKSAVLDLIGRTVNHPAWQGSDTGVRAMDLAMSRLRKVTHPGSLVFLISDFRELDDVAIAHLADIARHNDVAMIHVYDPIESALPERGSYKVSDGRDELIIDAGNETLRKRYKARFDDHVARLEQLAKKHRMSLLHLATNDDVVGRLRRGLNKDHIDRFGTS